MSKLQPRPHFGKPKPGIRRASWPIIGRLEPFGEAACTSRRERLYIRSTMDTPTTALFMAGFHLHTLGAVIATMAAVLIPRPVPQETMAAWIAAAWFIPFIGPVVTLGFAWRNRRPLLPFDGGSPDGVS